MSLHVKKKNGCITLKYSGRQTQIYAAWLTTVFISFRNFWTSKSTSYNRIKRKNILGNVSCSQRITLYRWKRKTSNYEDISLPKVPRSSIYSSVHNANRTRCLQLMCASTGLYWISKFENGFFRKSQNGTINGRRGTAKSGVNSYHRIRSLSYRLDICSRKHPSKVFWWPIAWEFMKILIWPPFSQYFGQGFTLQKYDQTRPSCD